MSKGHSTRIVLPELKVASILHPSYAHSPSFLFSIFDRSWYKNLVANPVHMTSSDKPQRIPLVFPCPGTTCAKDAIVNWQHKSCGTQAFVNWEGDITCENASCGSFFIQDTKFNCMTKEHKEKHGEEYVKFDLQDLWDAIHYAMKSGVLNPKLGPYRLEFFKKVEQRITERWTFPAVKTDGQS